MKVLAIIGSKRKNGNTATLVEQSLKPFEEAGIQSETIFLGDLNFEGCRGCEGCAKTNRCVIKDDMQDVYTPLREADVLIAGSPTYFYNMSSDMKKFIDRCYCFTSYAADDRSAWNSELELGMRKFAGLISICEQNSLDDLGFTAIAMEAAFGSLGYRIVFSQKVLHAFKAGAVITMNDTMNEAYQYGNRLLKTLQISRK